MELPSKLRKTLEARAETQRAPDDAQDGSHFRRGPPSYTNLFELLWKERCAASRLLDGHLHHSVEP